MSDFTNENITPLYISSVTRFGILGSLRLAGGSGSIASITWPSANLAIYSPFSLPWYYPIRRMFWTNGSTVGGNASIGIYTADGKALYTSASTVTSGASTLQFVTPATDLWLPPGAYYVGVAFSGTTNVAFGASGATAIAGRLVGLLEEALGGLPMPTPAATFAQYGRTVAPLVGFSRVA